jgi:hypothetical protein
LATTIKPEKVRLRTKHEDLLLITASEGHPILVPGQGAKDAEGNLGPGYVDFDVPRMQKYQEDIRCCERAGRLEIEVVAGNKATRVTATELATLAGW